MVGWAVAAVLAAAGCSKTAESRPEGTPPLLNPAESEGAIPGGEPRAAAPAVPAEPAAADPGDEPAGDPEAKEARVAAAGAEAAPARAEAEAAPAKAKDAPAKAGDAPAGRMRAETDEYVVEVKAPARADSGAASTVNVTIVPKGEWKLNMDFPTRLIVESPDGVAVDKANQRRQDAVRFDDDRGVFRMSFTAASAGAKAFKAQFRFAVCTEATCDPKREELAWVVDVR